VDPKPQLIAQAIAAFGYNNLRCEELGLAPLANAVIPGITMVGTMPSFCKIHVTTGLVNVVQYGIYSQFQTVVQAHIPTILLCFAAFRNLLCSVRIAFPPTLQSSSSRPRPRATGTHLCFFSHHRVHIMPFSVSNVNSSALMIHMTIPKLHELVWSGSQPLQVL
jgi:hypothetical protein